MDGIYETRFSYVEMVGVWRDEMGYISEKLLKNC
jgi:hypothetical protein